MKLLGIVGGLGPESTAEYYRLIVAAYRERVRDGSYPAFVVNSVDMKRVTDTIFGGDLPSAADYLAHEAERLARAGADFGLIAANTPHVVFKEVQSRSPIPLVSIVEATRDTTLRLGLKRVGLFGTRSTMGGRFYPEAFEGSGVTLVVPDAEEQDYIHDKYVGELVRGVFLEETRARLLAIADRLREQEGIEGLILGGTELPLILRDDSHNGIRFLDTTKIHVERAVELMLSDVPD
jgi:aspartate racemase